MRVHSGTLSNYVSMTPTVYKPIYTKDVTGLIVHVMLRVELDDTRQLSRVNVRRRYIYVL